MPVRLRSGRTLPHPRDRAHAPASAFLAWRKPARSANRVSARLSQPLSLEERHHRPARNRNPHIRRYRITAYASGTGRVRSDSLPCPGQPLRHRIRGPSPGPCQARITELLLQGLFTRLNCKRSGDGRRATMNLCNEPVTVFRHSLYVFARRVPRQNLRKSEIVRASVNPRRRCLARDAHVTLASASNYRRLR